MIKKYTGELQNSVVVEAAKEEEGISPENKNPFDIAVETSLNGKSMTNNL
jgi:hypothetical protein